MTSSRPIVAAAARVLATLILLAAAAALAWTAWQHYVYAPWTRDARVQADVLNVAPEVSGTVAEVAVTNNSYVHKGDLLFRIAPARFKNALASAKAALAQAKAGRQYAARNARRLEQLPAGGVSTQDVQQAQSQAQSAAASVSQAKAKLAQARQNLAWASVRSPVDGYVTHLLLDEGDYASTGASALTLVDAASFRIIAYFEETKLGQISPGDHVRISLMSSNAKLHGHVASIGRGIALENNAPGERNLPNVNPVFQWVRLAQRVPVTIDFDRRPSDLHLSVGLTATVHVAPRPHDTRRLPNPRADPQDGLVAPPPGLDDGA